LAKIASLASHVGGTQLFSVFIFTAIHTFFQGRLLMWRAIPSILPTLSLKTLPEWGSWLN
jgi:hypothetical protein